jgi:hypothetical protein
MMACPISWLALSAAVSTYAITTTTALSSQTRSAQRQVLRRLHLPRSRNHVKNRCGRRLCSLIIAARRRATGRPLEVAVRLCADEASAAREPTPRPFRVALRPRSVALSTAPCLAAPRPGSTCWQPDQRVCPSQPATSLRLRLRRARRSQPCGRLDTGPLSGSSGARLPQPGPSCIRSTHLPGPTASLTGLHSLQPSGLRTSQPSAQSGTQPDMVGNDMPQTAPRIWPEARLLHRLMYGLTTPPSASDPGCLRPAAFNLDRPQTSGAFLGQLEAEVGPVGGTKLESVLDAKTEDSRATSLCICGAHLAMPSVRCWPDRTQLPCSSGACSLPDLARPWTTIRP